jgi:hypothetical protein
MNTKTPDDDQEEQAERLREAFKKAAEGPPPGVEPTEVGEDDVDKSGDEETTPPPGGEFECANCGHSRGVYDDATLDIVVLNYNEEWVHYGCRGGPM